MRPFIAFAVLLVAGLCCVEQAEARRYRTSYYRSSPSFRSARPVTGYGANIHRNFILKQEARRALQGQRVRNRGNILWYR